MLVMKNDKLPPC